MAASAQAPATAHDIAGLTQQVVTAISAAVYGKENLARTALMVCLAGGHLLLEDIPGVGKTALAKALGAALGGRVRRIQCTPDLLPSDITGSSIFNQRSHEFEFHPGPIFANVVIADEINRAEPKTQSALLECMGEHQVTADGRRYKLPAPFVVVATQNPTDMQGTFPIPEAQRDRFMARLSVGYPSPESEQALLSDPNIAAGATDVKAVTSVEAVQGTIAAIAAMHMPSQVAGYLVNLVQATRHHPDIRIGASTRAAVHCGRAARAHAAMSGRNTVAPEDIKAVAPLVFPHRLILTRDTGDTRSAATSVITSLLDEIPNDAQVGRLAERHHAAAQPPRAKGKWQ